MRLQAVSRRRSGGSSSVGMVVGWYRGSTGMCLNRARSKRRRFANRRRLRRDARARRYGRSDSSLALPLKIAISAARPQSHAPSRAASYGDKLLRDQRCANSGEDVAHSAGRHAGIAGRVVARGAAVFAHDGAAAFEQKRDWKLAAQKRVAVSTRDDSFALANRRFISPGCGVSNRGPLRASRTARCSDAMLRPSASTTDRLRRAPR